MKLHMFFCLVHLSTKSAANKVEQPICTGETFHIKCDLSTCAVNLWIFLFGYAAYGLLFKQTRALRSNSVFKAIALLAKPAKICQRYARTSGEICTLILEGD